MRSAVWLQLALATTIVACARPRPSDQGARDWALIRPPEITDLAAPRGTRLVPTAPQSEWLRQEAFDSEGQCDDARQKNAQTAITHFML